jgi:hypothetical protein
MSQELSTTCTFGVAKGAATENIGGGGAIDLTGINYIKTTQSISTNATAINLGALGSIGQYLINNTDLTNPVYLFTSVSGVTFGLIKPGQGALGYFPPAITAPAAKAVGASVQIQYLITEI